MIYLIILSLTILICISNEKILNFNTFFVSSILYLICFGIFPLVLMSVDIPYSYQKGWLRFITSSTNDRYYFSTACFFSLLGYLLFFIGYKVKAFKPKELIVFKPKQTRLLLYLSIVLFIVGISSFLVYLASLGSITQGFLSNNRMLFEDDKVDVESSVSFLRQFSKIILSSTYFLWGIMKIDKSRIAKIFFYVAFITSFFYLFYSSGRLSVVTFLFTFVLSESVLKGKIPFLKIGLVTAIAAFLTLFGKSLFRIFIYEDSLERSYERMEGDKFLTPLLDFVGEFSFPFLSFVRAIDVNSEWLLFKDLIFWFTYALPSRLFPLVENTSLQNTKNILGPTVSEAVVPSDILSYGYLNFGFMGLVLTPFFYGIVCKWIDSFKKTKTNPLSTIFSIALVFIISFRVMYFDPKHLFKGSFYFYFILLIILFIIYFNKRVKIR